MAMSANSPEFNLFIGENYGLILKKSIQKLLDDHREGVSDFSGFVSTFYQLMQARVDPPLEAIWFYSALSFRISNSTQHDLLDRVLIAKDMFQLLAACSASCSSSKSIALLAPVVFEVYRSVVDLSGKELSFKREKRVMREIKSLIEVILGYIGVCCCKDLNEEDVSASVGLLQPLDDLVCFWMGDGAEGNGKVREGLASFFPLVSDEISRGLSMGKCDVNYLAGVVTAEAFLLRLCLNFRVGLSRVELQKELRTWAVGSITGFQNFYFSEALVRMLLEPTLPVTSLLSSEDEVFLRKVLYDAVILVEYSFLNPERAIQLPAERLKSFAITRLIVIHEAIELFREDRDQTRALSYINSFFGSHLPSQLIKWVTSDISMEGKASKPNGSSPKAFLKWFLNLEDQGIRIFDDSISKCHAKLVLDISKADYEQPAYKAGGKRLDADLFYVDKNGEEEDGNKEDNSTNESMSAAFVAAARNMKLAENHGERKRKEGSSVEKKKQIKFLKYNLCDNYDSSREKFSLSSNDGLSRGSQVENPLSDEDMEIKEQ